MGFRSNRWGFGSVVSIGDRATILAWDWGARSNPGRLAEEDREAIRTRLAQRGVMGLRSNPRIAQQSPGVGERSEQGAEPPSIYII
jgi:hypothetical protein